MKNVPHKSSRWKHKRTVSFSHSAAQRQANKLKLSRVPNPSRKHQARKVKIHPEGEKWW